MVSLFQLSSTVVAVLRGAGEQEKGAGALDAQDVSIHGGISAGDDGACNTFRTRRRVSACISRGA